MVTVPEVDVGQAAIVVIEGKYLGVVPVVKLPVGWPAAINTFLVYI